MADRTDYLKNDTHDLIIQNGDFANGLSADQHVEDVLLASPGNWRQWPLLGVGIKKYLSGPWNPGQLRRDIRLHIEEMDGQPIKDKNVNSPTDFFIEV